MRALSLVLLVGCDAPLERKLPSSAHGPGLSNRPPEAVCATDIAFDDSGEIAVRYRYHYDALGRLALATATFTDAPDAIDTVEYSWDNLDHLVHLVQHSEGAGTSAEIAAQYNTLGDLLEYTYRETGPRFALERRYTYSEFTDAGQPTREVMIERGVETRYQLAYDALGRIAVAAPEGGEGDTTVYTYDDDGRTVTIDMGNGAYRGQLVYDDANHQLAETWTGNAPSVIATEDRYDWIGDRLVKVTRRAGSYDAPNTLRTIQVDTHRYDCP